MRQAKVCGESGMADTDYILPNYDDPRLSKLGSMLI